MSDNIVVKHNIDMHVLILEKIQNDALQMDWTFQQ